MKKLPIIIFVIWTLNTSAQNFAIDNRMQNVLYANIDNPLKIVIENTSCDSFFVTTDNGIINGDSCSFYVRPNKIGKANIEIFKLNKLDTLSLGFSEFRVKKMPKPIANVCGKNSGYMTKSLMAANARINAFSANFDYDIKFWITKYSVKITRQEKIIYTNDFNGYKFTEEFINTIMTLKTDDEVTFFNILAKASGPGQYLDEETLDQISIKIQ